MAFCWIHADGLQQDEIWNLSFGESMSIISNEPFFLLNCLNVFLLICNSTPLILIELFKHIRTHNIILFSGHYNLDALDTKTYLSLLTCCL